MCRFFVSTLFFIGGISLTSAATLQCYNNSDISIYEVATLENPETLIKSTCLNISLPTYFYTFGFGGRPNGTASEDAINKGVQNKNQNFILLNWQKEASRGSTTLEASLRYLTFAIPNAYAIGVKLGNALLRLVKYGLDLAIVRLVGHSLGGHLMGHAGRAVNAKGTCVQRITGLDPAREGYEKPTLLQPLDSTCGCFVDCIHTDPGNYGLNQTCGTIDVWINYGSYLNGTNRQPGCEPGDFPMFSTEDICSHDRSWKINNLAMQHSDIFIASKAANYYDWVSKNGESDETIFLGNEIDLSARGNYFMDTSGEDPYGEGVDGLSH